MAPKRLADILGIDYLGHVSDVWLAPRNADSVVVEVGRLTRFRELNILDPSSFSAIGLDHLRGLRNFTSLDLSYGPVSNAWLEHISGLTNLTELHLEDTQVTDAGLFHLKGLTKLSSLGLGGTKVTDDGLPQLKGMTRLSYLNIDNTQITDAGLANLKGLSKLSESFSAATTSPTPVWCIWRGSRICPSSDSPALKSRAMGEFICRLTNLTELQLDESEMTDHGLVHLNGLTKLSNLCLSSTKVTDAGLVHLRGLTNLSELNLCGTEVTHGVKQLQQVLPTVRISWQ